MSRLSLHDWYRYLETQFEQEATPASPPAEQVPMPPSPQTSEPRSSSTPHATAASVGDKGQALVSIRVPEFAEFVPFLRQELQREAEAPPQATTAEPPAAAAQSDTGAATEGHEVKPTETVAQAAELETPSDGPRLRKRKKRGRVDPEAIVPPEADEIWAKLPKYLRYLAEWTDDSVPRKYYPVRGRDESREELIARLTDPVLTLEETARLLGVCPATVRRYTDRGWLRCFRTEGNQRRFRLSDIVAFLEEQALRQPRGNRNAKQKHAP